MCFDYIHTLEGEHKGVSCIDIFKSKQFFVLLIKTMRRKIIPYDPALRKLARKLRNNSTFAEIKLWIEIKNRSLGVQFHRQVPLDRFIVDFYCYELMLAIEADGESHHLDYRDAKDVLRQERLEGLGVAFIRFDDREVIHNISGVITSIELKIAEIVEAKGIVINKICKRGTAYMPTFRGIPNLLEKGKLNID